MDLIQKVGMGWYGFLVLDPKVQVQPYKGYFCILSKKSL